MKKSSLFLVAILTSSLCAAQKTSTHPTASFHGGETRLGVYENKEYKNFGPQKWILKTEGKVFSSPAISDGTLFIGSEDQNLYAVDAKSGKLKWKFKTGGAVHSSPAIDGANVYFGSFDGNYYCVDTKTGKEVWKFKTGGEQFFGARGYFNLKPENEWHADPWQYYLSSPLTTRIDGVLTVFFGSSDGNVYAVDGAKGTLRWKYATNGPVHSSPSLYDGRIYIGSWDAVVYALDAKNGNLVWKYQTGQQTGMTGVQATPAVADNIVYIGARDAKFYALDAKTGAKKWEYNADNSWVLTTAAVKDNTVFIGTSDSYKFVALDASTGKEKFFKKVKGYVYSSPAIVGDAAFFGDFTGNLFAVDLASDEKSLQTFTLESRKLQADKILRGDTLDFVFASTGKDLSMYKELKSTAEVFYSLGSILSSPVVHDGIIYFGSANGNVYAIELK